MANLINVCVIGTGRAGMIHARSYNGSVPGARLAALCDPVEESLKAAQLETGVEKVYTDYRDALADPEIDAVVIVTPTGLHREIVVAAANAGKHVFCEKPMATDANECDEMIEACRKNNVKLQLGFMRRFDKSFRRGKEIIDSGKIGDVTLVKCGGECLDEYYLSTGTLTENTNYINMCRTQVRVRMNTPARYFLQNPLGNHHIMLYGNYEIMLNEFLQLNACKRIE